MGADTVIWRRELILFYFLALIHRWLDDRHKASQALYSLQQRHKRGKRLRWALRIQVKFISEATAAITYCFLGSHGANYIPAITAENKRLRYVLRLMDTSGQANRSYYWFFSILDNIWHISMTADATRRKSSEQPLPTILSFICSRTK